MNKRFPDSFKFGTATAATQVEGGDPYSNWYEWSKQGKIAGGGTSFVAADHYNRYEEDIQIMRTLNQQVYRLSLEWSRFFPKEGQLEQKGIEHYRKLLLNLKENNIEPLITLHHFSCPQWVQDQGGWTNEKTVADFLEFVEVVISELGGLCSEYCTINEPNVFATDSYIDGKYPPGHTDDMKSYFKTSKNLILAHLKSYKLIHKICAKKYPGKKTRVGFALHIAYFETQSFNPLTKLSRNLIDYNFHTIFIKGMLDGQLVFPLGKGYPEGKGLYCDFIGVNYYSRHIVKNSWNPAMLFGVLSVDDTLTPRDYNDLGWEIYPKGLSMVIKDIYNTYELPVYITENGIPDAKDVRRAEFIHEHLNEVLELIDQGIPIEKYYHWSLLDNLEWNDGYGPRFGLVHVNYETLERTIRKSGHYYGEISKARELLPWETYMSDEEERL